MNEVGTYAPTTSDKDDFLYALGQTLGFYGKELDRMQTSFWWTACRERPVKKLKNALIEYTKIGKFAPKPADILTLVDNMNINRGDRAEAHKIPTTSCPPDIAKAWMWFLGRITEESENFAGIFESGGDISITEQERYLHVVNHEAHKYSTPEAIPEEYRLPEVWG